MATTTNFGWETPDDTDLVKDGAAAIRTALGGVDTSFVDLKGGTTGQVLSKATNTDLDFTWVAQDDSNAIQNTIVDAKGDLIAASANDTPARLAVGANGEQIVADSSASTGLRYQGNFAAGKNKIINGDFGIWQRGTSFTTAGAYTADRFFLNAGSTSGLNVSRQTFTAGAAPVAGYEGQFFADVAGTLTSATAGYIVLLQRIENVRTLANQTVTYSFWAKGSTSGTITTAIAQFFGSGGSPSATVFVGNSSHSITTAWQRFTVTIALPSISGKTLGTDNNSTLQLNIVKNIGTDYVSDYGTANFTGTLSVWGVQLEAGSVATAFQTATGTIQGELAACQRYYTTSIPTGYTITDFPIMGTIGAGGVIFTCSQGSTNDLFGTIQYPVTLRSTPTINIYSGNNRTSGSVRDMVTGTDATVSAYSAQTGQNKNFVYMGVGSFTNSRQYGFHYTASAEL